MSESATITTVTALVTPIVTDLRLELYDVEFRGGTLRITIDTPPGSVREDGRPAGVDLDTLAVATRLIGRELDHNDPMPGHYTLEVTSPGLERTLRTPAHFRREIGKAINVRLRDMGEGNERRFQGQLIAADDHGFTVLGDDGRERTCDYIHLDRAKTVFVWGPQPKPGSPKSSSKGAKSSKKPAAVTSASHQPSADPAHQKEQA
jgi:ribosome maturation factor RimP